MPGLDSPRNPFEVFLLSFGLVVGSPLLFGAPTPGSTAALLGPTLVRVWAWMLCVGCLVALTGAWWTWWRWLSRWWSWAEPDIGTALLIEQVGLVAVGVASGIYTWGIVAADGLTGRYIAAGIFAGFGVACLWRAVLIQLWVKSTIRRKRQQEDCGQEDDQR